MTFTRQQATIHLLLLWSAWPGLPLVKREPDKKKEGEEGASSQESSKEQNGIPFDMITVEAHLPSSSLILPNATFSCKTFSMSTLASSFNSEFPEYPFTRCECCSKLGHRWECDEKERKEKETVQVQQPIVLGIGNQEMTQVEESGRSSEEGVVSYISEAVEGEISLVVGGVDTK